MKNIIVVLLIIVFCASCKKDDVPPSSYEDGVWFFASSSQAVGTTTAAKMASVFTKSYTFYFKSDADRDTIALPTIRLMGMPSTSERHFKLIALDSSTAKENVNYQWLSDVFPSGGVTASTGVIVLKTPNLDNDSVTLYVALEPNDDFPASMGKDTLSGDGTFCFSTHYKLVITNQVRQPPYWSTVPYFSTWTQVKYNFIAQTIGIKLGLTPVTSDMYPDYYIYYLRCRSALAAYNAANPSNPLKDENGKAVTF